MAAVVGRVALEAGRELSALELFPDLVARELADALSVEHGAHDQVGVVEAALALRQELLGFAVDFELPFGNSSGSEPVVDAWVFAQLFHALGEAAFGGVC